MLTDAQRERTDMLEVAIDTMLVGGNHLANYLINSIGPDFSERFPPGMLHAKAMEELGQEYDVWACWAAIMRARNSLE